MPRTKLELWFGNHNAPVLPQKGDFCITVGFMKKMSKYALEKLFQRTINYTPMSCKVKCPFIAVNEYNSIDVDC